MANSINSKDSVKCTPDFIKKTKKQKLTKRKNKLNWRSIVTFFKLFLQTSSIHGLNHVSSKKWQPFERCVWFLSVCAGVFGIVWISLSIWHRYQINPTVISMERNYKDWNTSFPAVTICPYEKTDGNSLQKYIRVRYSTIKDTPKLEEFLKSLSNATYHNFNKLSHNKLISPDSFLLAVVETHFKLTFDAVSSNMDTPEATFLQRTITEMGLCYTHNSKIAIYNEPSYWKTNNWTIGQNVTTLVGNPLDGDMFAQILNMNSGSQVFIHNSDEIPDITTKANAVPSMYFETLQVSALNIYSTQEVRSLTVRQRSCRFWDESNLFISPVYSYNMCRMECRMKLCYKLCSCVPFFYRPSNKYKICGVEGMHCLGRQLEKLLQIQVNAEGSKEHGCQCLPPCDDTNYQIDLESTVTWFLGTSMKWGLVKYPRLRLKRDILFGFSDLLVQIGGSAGLFLGCSVLSFIEIGYFFTLRIYWFYRHTK